MPNLWLFKEEPYVDPDGAEDRLVVVDVRPVTRLDRPVSLQQIKAEPLFADSPLVRIGRLSVVPITPQQWRCIQRLARA